MRVKTIFTVVALMVLVVSLGMSQYSAVETFNYPKGVSIDTLMGGATDGWAGPWYKIVANQNNAMITSDTAVPYDAMAYAVSHIGRGLTCVPDTNGKEQRYGRNLAKTWPNDSGKVYWISFMMDVKYVVDASTWLGVKFFYGASAENGMLGKGHGMDMYTCGSGWHGGAGPEVSTTPWTVGPVWLVGKVVMKGAASATQDSIYMWINPDPAGAEPNPKNADAVTFLKMANGFNIIRIEYGGDVGTTTGKIGLNWGIDELRLGQSYASVATPVVKYFAQENFIYPKGTSIDTLMGGATDGWAGPWYKIVANQSNAMVTSDTALPYDALAYAVPHISYGLTCVPDTNGKEQRYGRNLDKTWPNDSGKVYWISFPMDVKYVVDASTWLGVKFYNGANGESGMLGKGHGMDMYTCGGGWHGGAGPEVSTTPWTVGPVWLVGKVVMKGAASATQDSIYMWINPDPAGAEPNPKNADAVTFLKFTSGFNVLRIEYGGDIGTTKGKIGLNWGLDEIRLGQSYTDVSSVYGVLVTSVTKGPLALPNQFSLSQNYPNPFNPSSIISYSLVKSGNVRLTVYDLLGREIAVLVDGIQTLGDHQVTFSGKNLTSGIYFYRLETTGSSITKKMVLMK